MSCKSHTQQVVQQCYIVFCENAYTCHQTWYSVVSLFCIVSHKNWATANIKYQWQSLHSGHVSPINGIVHNSWFSYCTKILLQTSPRKCENISISNLGVVRNLVFDKSGLHFITSRSPQCKSAYQVSRQSSGSAAELVTTEHHFPARWESFQATLWGAWTKSHQF